MIAGVYTGTAQWCRQQGLDPLSGSVVRSVQFSSVPRPIGSSGGHGGRFNGDPLPASLSRATAGQSTQLLREQSDFDTDRRTESCV